MASTLRAIEGGLAAEADQVEVPTAQSRSSTLADSPGKGEHEVLEKTGSHDDSALEKGREDVVGEVADTGILTGFKLYAVFLSLMLCVLMFALDQSIVATAIPIIVSEFNAFASVSWIITAYFLTQCGLILLAGGLLTIIKAKWILLAAIFWFELGSLICGVAKSMNVLILGRAIQGVGASMMFVSILSVIVVITTVQQRPAFMASFGFVFVISSVAGPLMGGALTQHVTWRWCFYINLPVGGIAALAVVFLLPARAPVGDGQGRTFSIAAGLKRLDWLGGGMIFIIVTCLLLALQWGGNNYRWDSWRIILLFTLGGVMVFVFAAWQRYMGKRALIPVDLFKNRTEVSAAITMFMLMMAMLGGTYQLPLYYEAVRNHSPTKAGIDIIPFMVSVCIGIFISGGLTQKFGRYLPYILAGPPLSIIGYALLYTIKADTSNAKLIGFQWLAGFGIGLSFQNVLLAVQAEYADRPHLIPQATGVISFFQLTGGALGVGIINTVQSIYLNSQLRSKAPNVDFNLVRESVQAIYTLPADQQGPVIDAYVTAITKSFLPIFIAISIGWIAAFGIRNHDLRKIALPAGGVAA